MDTGSPRGRTIAATTSRGKDPSLVWSVERRGDNEQVAEEEEGEKAGWLETGLAGRNKMELRCVALVAGYVRGPDETEAGGVERSRGRGESERETGGDVTTRGG